MVNQIMEFVGNKTRPVRCADQMDPEGAKLLLEYVERKLKDDLMTNAKQPLKLTVAFATLRDVMSPIVETAEAAPQGWRERITLEAFY